MIATAIFIASVDAFRAGFLAPLTALPEIKTFSIRPAFQVQRDGYGLRLVPQRTFGDYRACERGRPEEMHPSRARTTAVSHFWRAFLFLISLPFPPPPPSSSVKCRDASLPGMGIRMRYFTRPIIARASLKIIQFPPFYSVSSLAKCALSWRR